MKQTMFQVDAFTDKLFGGNPAAVVPLQNWPADELMQQVAMENNLSETAFFVKSSPADHHKSDYHLRWFTPEFEIDLCGHATLASAFVIKNFLEPQLEVINFSTEKAGTLRSSVKDEMYTLDFPARMPEACIVPGRLLESLGMLQPVEVLKSRDYFVVLEDEASVRAVVPDLTIMKELDTIGVIITAKGKSADVVSRCFYPGLGIPEDPVTGSAHCNIVPYWNRVLGKTDLFCKQLSHRGGELQCQLKGDRVLMSGKCVMFMKGEIYF